MVQMNSGGSYKIKRITMLKHTGEMLSATSGRRKVLWKSSALLTRIWFQKYKKKRASMKPLVRSLKIEYPRYTLSSIPVSIG